jgi:hypothetical protein
VEMAKTEMENARVGQRAKRASGQSCAIESLGGLWGKRGYRK